MLEDWKERDQLPKRQCHNEKRVNLMCGKKEGMGGGGGGGWGGLGRTKVFVFYIPRDSNREKEKGRESRFLSQWKKWGPATYRLKKKEKDRETI